jgi:hypothetical protein
MAMCPRLISNGALFVIDEVIALPAQSVCANVGPIKPSPTSAAFYAWAYPPPVIDRRQQRLQFANKSEPQGPHNFLHFLPFTQFGL